MEILRGNGKFKILIDKEDHDFLKREKWYITVNNNNGTVVLKKYKSGSGSNRKWKDKYMQVYMSRFLMNCPPNMCVDHINGNKLDNRRFNLRICTKRQNSINKKRSSRNNGGTSKYRGVYRNKNKHKNMWSVNIVVNKAVAYRDFFNNEKEAAFAYDKAAKRIHGKYAYLNFPEKK